jgi:uncharacterized protein
MIRAVLDPNVLISYLLSNNPDATVARLMDEAVRERYRILVSPSLLVETIAAAVTKPALASRISRSSVGRLVELLLDVGELVPELELTPAPISRDPKDDYLLAHATLEAADYIVSGDRDLLAIKHISPVKIVSPAEFARILNDLPDEEN